MSQQLSAEKGRVVRPFRADDRSDFLDLHGEIFEPDYGREWFAWKYEDNPYVDHVPIFVAERDGELVGARPFFALEMSVDGDRHLALQPGDTMVHPDHRRQGLFTRMTEAAIERYGDGEPSFFFNFPNRQSGPGYLKLGWERVGRRSTYYRIQDPSALLSQGQGSTATALAARLSKPVVAGYNRLRDALADPVEDLRVRRHESVPARELATLCQEARRGGSPRGETRRGGIHVRRSQRFYEWRFDNPGWEYVTYVAEAAGEPVAGLVAGTSDESGATTTKVTDVAPSPQSVDGDALATLLHRVIEDAAGSDVLAAPSGLPRSILAERGFHPDDRPPLSSVSNPSTHVVRSLTGEWELNGVDLTDAERWNLAFSEHDTS